MNLTFKKLLTMIGSNSRSSYHSAKYFIIIQ